MKTQAQVVVIGGGVVGASVLYHLTLAGWTDVMMVERRELTHGSTWHSAGGMHTLNGDPNVAALQRYTVELYDKIQAESGRDCGIHMTGGLQLADTPERMDYLRMAHARGRYLGMETELVSPKEAHELVPFLDPKYFVGAMYDKHEGHVDPSGVTHAYAECAQQRGAEINKYVWVHDITRAADGTWDLHVHDTRQNQDLGIINCEHFVNAGGLWAREVGRMTGLELPILAMEHMYLITEEVPQLEEWRQSSKMSGFHVVDLGGEMYMREEGNSLLLGTYERKGVPWAPHQTDWSFGAQLLTPDLERIGENLEVGFNHFPIFQEIGIKDTINGPFTFAPDGNPLIGPVKGQPGHWLACGVMAGLSQGGGVGLSMANWMTEGDPGFDIWGMDNARFGDWATPRYTNSKVRENYGRRFRITFPNEELPDAREHMQSPIHDRLESHNAVWGASYGLEVALWFQTHGKAEENVTFRRSNAFDVVAEEVAAVRNGVGIFETTGYAKYEVTGTGARAWLDGLLTNNIPPAGRLALTPMLNHQGKIIGDFTVGCLTDALGDERFMIFGSGAAQQYHERWFREQLRVASPAGGDVSLRVCGNELTGLSIAGPNARVVLDELTDFDVSNDEFGFLDFRQTWVGSVPCMVGRVTFTGDLGYEIWCAASFQQQLFDTLSEAGRPHRMRLFGLRALDSMRLDKGWGSWGTEYRPIYDPYEANMGWMVRLGDESKSDFVGRNAAEAAKQAGPKRKLVLFEMDAGTGDEAADCIGNEPIWHNGPDGNAVVGWVTSGGYAHHSEKSIAMGYVPAVHATSDGPWEIEVLGVMRSATRLTEAPFDPSGARMRS
ncbi:FAD-dependent oxidoreductase [uncultured Ilumatobacter sp.]|jgi:dimethylglycine dehydrogenase|uniref:GcvT family protein n=1 Tax=Ilumatobacter sp. TaxID=1967498 RepID=UPI0030A1D310|tara:strand:+ start:1626 stop:4130 length:2505 start_codon:yes stop_codon:yes gene_type:complete